MKRKTLLMAGTAAIALFGTSGAALAAASPTSGDASYQALADRVARLEQALEAQQDKAAADHTRLSGLEQNFNDTVWTFDNARPTVKSGDGRFTMAIRVRFQFDDANFFQSNNVNLVTPTHDVQFKDLSNGVVVRRAFFGVEGKAFNDFWYEFRLNAGGSDGGSAGAGGVPTAGEGDPVLSLARVAYIGIPNFRVNVGIIEPAFMFEGTTSSGQLMFMERPEIDNIAADSFGGGDSRRGLELVFQKQDAFFAGDNLVLQTALTGNKTGSSAGHGLGGDEQTQWMVHANYRFWSNGYSNAAFGGDYARILNSGTAAAGGGSETIRFRDRPQIRVDGSRLIDTGAMIAQNGQMYAFNAGMNIDNFFLGGEYAHFDVDRELVAGGPTFDHPNFDGWYVETSWVITGEPKQYTVSSMNNEVGGFAAPRVANPFSFDGDSWGAWELTARYSDTDLNWHENVAGGVLGGEERILLIGMNWYLNQTVKLQINDMFVNVDKMGAGVIPPIKRIGQNLNILGVRLQFSN